MLAARRRSSVRIGDRTSTLVLTVSTCVPIADRGLPSTRRPPSSVRRSNRKRSPGGRLWNPHFRRVESPHLATDHPTRRVDHPDRLPRDPVVVPAGSGITSAKWGKARWSGGMCAMQAETCVGGPRGSPKGDQRVRAKFSPHTSSGLFRWRFVSGGKYSTKRDFDGWHETVTTIATTIA